MQFPIYPTLRDSLGTTAAWALLETFGGREISVPRRLNPRDPLTLLLGVPAAAVLIQRYGGKVIKLPPTDWKAETILHWKAEGKTNAWIAAMVGLSERQVLRICSRFRNRASTPAPAVAASGGGR